MRHLINNKNVLHWLQFSPWFFAIGLLFWFSSFGFLGLGIDQEYALFRDDQRIWLSQGRWFVFLLTQYIYPQPVIVYFPHLAFVLCMVASYLIIINAFNISFRQRWLALLAFPAFMAHPVWYFIAEFAANIMSIAIAMLAIAIAIWLYSQYLLAKSATHPALPTYLNLSIQIALLCLALGSYQSLFFVAWVLYAGLTITYLAQQTTLKSALKPLLVLGLIMVASLIANALLTKLLQKAYHTAPSYLENHVYISLWLEQPAFALKSYLNAIFNFYIGNKAAYQSTLFASGLIIGFALLLSLTQTRSKPFLLKVLLALLVLSILCIPLTTQALVIKWQAPHRTFLAVSTVLWLAAIYLLIRLEKTRFSIIPVLLILVLNVQMLHLHARYDSAKHFLYQHDKQVALQLYERILHLVPDYDPRSSYPLSVYGAIDYQSIYGGLPSTLLDGSFFVWDDGNPKRVSAYMRSQNHNGLVPVDDATQAQLLPLYEAMPTWPKKGSVQIHDGTILVKLGSIQ